MTFLSIPSCSSGFMQVLINVWPMMYIAAAYNVLFLPEFLSNRLQTFVQ